MLASNLFIEEIVSSLLSPLPSIKGHYLVSSKVELKASILTSIGWFDKMVAPEINFKEKAKKHGVSFQPGTLPTLDAFKISMLNKEFRKFMLKLFPGGPFKRYHESLKMV